MQSKKTWTHPNLSVRSLGVCVLHNITKYSLHPRSPHMCWFYVCKRNYLWQINNKSIWLLYALRDGKTTVHGVCMADIQTRKWKDFCPLGKINVHQKSCHNSPETRVLIVFSAKVYSGSGTYSQHFNCPSFWHIDMSYSKFIFTSKFNTQYPIMTKWKMSF